ncbi:MAG: GNAT family N-acetyltransferase, partial [Calditrichia bacterium]
MSREITIRTVENKKDLMAFIKLPWKINRGDPNWVAPLIMDRLKFLNKEKNPFFKENPAEFFLAYRNGELVGRIAAILNHQHNQYYNDKTGFFGCLEAIEDQDVFDALLEKVKEWLRPKGCDLIMGPMNPSTNDEVGFLVDGFDTPPYFMMTHNPPYYNNMMMAAGFEKAKDLLAFYLDKEHLVITEKVKRVTDGIKKKFPVTIRAVNIKKLNDELEVFREIYNNAWSTNWGFVPLTPEEFDYVANDFKKIIDPELVLIAELAGKPVGFCLALPNYNEVFKKIPNGRLLPFGWLTFLLNKKKIKGIRVITLGAVKEYQHTGIGSLLYLEIIRRGLAQGYDRAELSWVLEDNELMIRPLQFLGAIPYKT